MMELLNTLADIRTRQLTWYGHAAGTTATELVSQWSKKERTPMERLYYWRNSRGNAEAE